MDRFDRFVLGIVTAGLLTLTVGLAADAIREHRIHARHCRELIGQVNRGGVLPTDDRNNTVTLKDAGCR